MNFTTNWGAMFLMFLIIGTLLTIFTLLVRAFFDETKEWMHNTYGKIKRFIHELHKKYNIVWRIFNKIHGNELSYSIDIIFQLFCNFYELNKYDMPHWGWDKQLFPDGGKEISDLYKWITKTRVDNYIEANNLVQSNGHFEYWGALYKGFKFRFNKKGELIVSPHDNEDKFVFERITMKMYNTLYNLDTQKCVWILERRKVFGF